LREQQKKEGAYLPEMKKMIDGIKKAIDQAKGKEKVLDRTKTDYQALIDKIRDNKNDILKKFELPKIRKMTLMKFYTQG
jgi:hypothetical protein